MRYASAEAFRSALDQRLKNQAAETGTALVRLRKSVAFDRFLARLAQVASGRWVLKGALALDFRLGSATRTTKDIDLGRLDDEQAATEDFFAAQALDLGDFFTFAVQRTPALDAAAGFSAVRYRVQAELAGRRFEEFPIDVAFSDPLAWRPDCLDGTKLLGFAGIARIELPVLPIEQHVAEKLHAYTRLKARTTEPARARRISSTSFSSSSPRRSMAARCIPRSRPPSPHAPCRLFRPPSRLRRPNGAAPTPSWPRPSGCHPNSTRLTGMPPHCSTPCCGVDRWARGSLGAALGARPHRPHPLGHTSRRPRGS